MRSLPLYGHLYALSDDDVDKNVRVDEDDDQRYRVTEDSYVDRSECIFYRYV
jgi:hypothetical protein